jgi:hypothetical protein
MALTQYSQLLHRLVEERVVVTQFLMQLLMVQMVDQVVAQVEHLLQL